MQGRFEAAVEDYSKAVKLNPRHCRVRHLTFIACAMQCIGSCDCCYQLVQHLTSHLHSSSSSHTPTALQAYYNRAYSFDKLNKHAEAIADYNTTIALEPNTATAWHNRGSLHERLGDVKSAMRDFEQAIRLDPCGSLSFHARGRLTEQQGQLEASLADYDKAISLDPTQALFFRSRGGLSLIHI